MAKSEIILKNSKVLDFQEKNTSVGFLEKITSIWFWKDTSIQFSLKKMQVLNFNNAWPSHIFSV